MLCTTNSIFFRIINHSPVANARREDIRRCMMRMWYYCWVSPQHHHRRLHFWSLPPKKFRFHIDMVNKIWKVLVSPLGDAEVVWTMEWLCVYLKRIRWLLEWKMQWVCLLEFLMDEILHIEYPQHWMKPVSRHAQDLKHADVLGVGDIVAFFICICIDF